MACRQTEAMIEMAGDQKGIVVMQHRDTKKYHGALEVNHPTPSGCDRWMIVQSDNRGWDDPETARMQFELLLMAVAEKRREVEEKINGE